jgi:hypothetical protein
MTETVDCPNMTFSDTQKTDAHGKISLNVNRRVVNLACIAGVLTSPPNFSGPVGPHEVVMAAKHRQVIVETLLPSRVADRPPRKIGRALPDREVQPFDERCVQFRGVLGVVQSFFQSPRDADQGSSLDLDNAIVATRLDHLAVQTSWPQNASNRFPTIL